MMFKLNITCIRSQKLKMKGIQRKDKKEKKLKVSGLEKKTIDHDCVV